MERQRDSLWVDAVCMGIPKEAREHRNSEAEATDCSEPLDVWVLGTKFGSSRRSSSVPYYIILKHELQKQDFTECGYVHVCVCVCTCVCAR